jgi:hypothetical protein
LRQNPADPPSDRKRHVEKPVAGQKIKQAPVPAGSQFSARLVEHGAILDAGRTGALATTAQQAIIEMAKKPAVSFELTAGNTLHQGNSPSR